MPTWLILMEQLMLEPVRSADSLRFLKALVSPLCEVWSRHLRGSQLCERPWCGHLRGHLPCGMPWCRHLGEHTGKIQCYLEGRG